MGEGQGEISPKSSRIEPLNLSQAASLPSRVRGPPAVPSPLPSDGRGEGQGEVRVLPSLAIGYRLLAIECSPGSWGGRGLSGHSFRATADEGFVLCLLLSLDVGRPPRHPMSGYRTRTGGAASWRLDRWITGLVDWWRGTKERLKAEVGRGKWKWEGGKRDA